MGCEQFPDLHLWSNAVDFVSKISEAIDLAVLVAYVNSSILSADLLSNVQLLVDIQGERLV